MSGILIGGSSGRLERVHLTDRTYDSTQSSPTDAYAGVQYRSAGGEYGMNNSTSLSWNYSGTDWLVRGSAGDYWIKATPTGGTIQGSATSTWLQLNADRGWYISELGLGSDSTSLLIEVATDSGGTNVIESCTVALSVSVDP